MFVAVEVGRMAYIEIEHQRSLNPHGVSFPFSLFWPFQRLNSTAICHSRLQYLLQRQSIRVYIGISRDGITWCCLTAFLRVAKDSLPGLVICSFPLLARQSKSRQFREPSHDYGHIKHTSL